MRKYCNELKNMLEVNEKVQKLLSAKANVEQELTTQVHTTTQSIEDRTNNSFRLMT